MQWEKTVAYAWALQYWVKKTDQPGGGRPHLLVESVKELQEKMRCYLSFSDEEVLKGVIPPGETSALSTEEADLQSAMTSAGTPEEEATAGAARETAVERGSPKFLGLGEDITPVSTHGGWRTDPPSIKRSKTEVLQLGRKGGLNPSNWIIKDGYHLTGNPLTHARVRSHLANDTDSQFSRGGVTACLRRDPSLEEAHKVPLNPMAVGVISTPGVMTMSTSHIMKDEVTVITYMDIVTTLVGRVALSGPEQETSAQGPMIEDVTDLILRVVE